MKKRRIVVALGGNAILAADATAQAQQTALKKTAQQLVQLIERGDELIITHGNGPQVGNLLLQHAASHSEKNPAFPLDSLVAMTQGSIGYWLQNALQNALREKQIDKPVVSVVTQIVVNPDDPAFDEPTKPIGPFYTQEQAQHEMAQTNAIFKEDSGRGWRKVVASPKPQAIQELLAIETLLEAGQVVIAGGGGGVAVVQNADGTLTGVEAVIDKDFASQRLAELVKADVFIILTGVDYAYLNFNQANQEAIEAVDTDTLARYIQAGHFAPGSMLPKVEATLAFAENCPESYAVITSLEQLEQFISTETGTRIRKTQDF
ncbi:MAG: carbamate kinase [Aerococcaceae bacterium]|nr:carbamate kinase [Aerococcaceae bacterium]